MRPGEVARGHDSEAFVSCVTIKESQRAFLIPATQGHNEMKSFYLASSLKRFSASHHLQNCKASKDLEP